MKKKLMAVYKLDVGDKLTEDSFEEILQSIMGFKDCIAALKLSLSGFHKTLAASQEENEFLDVDLALELYQQSQKLLGLCEECIGEEFVPYALAAVRYFVEAQDGNHDFDTLDGFDDDKKVIDWIISHFNLLERLNKRKDIHG